MHLVETSCSRSRVGLRRLGIRQAIRQELDLEGEQFHLGAETFHLVVLPEGPREDGLMEDLQEAVVPA